MLQSSHLWRSDLPVNSWTFFAVAWCEETHKGILARKWGEFAIGPLVKELICYFVTVFVRSPKHTDSSTYII